MLLLSFSTSVLLAAEDEYIEVHEFDTELVDSLMNSVDYSKSNKSQNTPVPINNNPRPSNNSGDVSEPLQYGLLILLALFFAFVIYKIVISGKVNQQAGNEFDITAQDITEVDLDKVLTKYEEEKSLKEASRIIYLRVLKKLASNSVIKWEADKTNTQYVREVRIKKPEWLKEFRSITSLYEYMWYGDIEINESVYGDVKARFQKFENTIDGKA